MPPRTSFSTLHPSAATITRNPSLSRYRVTKTRFFCLPGHFFVNFRPSFAFFSIARIFPASRLCCNLHDRRKSNLKRPLRGASLALFDEGGGRGLDPPRQESPPFHIQGLSGEDWSQANPMKPPKQANDPNEKREAKVQIPAPFRPSRPFPHEFRPARRNLSATARAFHLSPRPVACAAEHSGEGPRPTE